MHDGKNQSVGKGHTKCLGGPGCGPRAACCTPLLYTVNADYIKVYFLLNQSDNPQHR